jgi:hypothetical protein
MLHLKRTRINIQSRCPPNLRFEQVLKKEKDVHTVKARSQHYGLESPFHFYSHQKYIRPILQEKGRAKTCWTKAERGLAARLIFYLKMGLADYEGMAGRPLTSARWTSTGLKRVIEPPARADKIGPSGLLYR